MDLPSGYDAPPEILVVVAKWGTNVLRLSIIYRDEEEEEEEEDDDDYIKVFQISWKSSIL